MGVDAIYSHEVHHVGLDPHEKRRLWLKVMEGREQANKGKPYPSVEDWESLRDSGWKNQSDNSSASKDRVGASDHGRFLSDLSSLLGLTNNLLKLASIVGDHRLSELQFLSHSLLSRLPLLALSSC